MINAPNVEIATNIIKELMDKCFPVRRVVTSYRWTPWITPLVKYLLRKKNLRAANRAVVYKLIEEN